MAGGRAEGTPKKPARGAPGCFVQLSSFGVLLATPASSEARGAGQHFERFAIARSASRPAVGERYHIQIIGLCGPSHSWKVLQNSASRWK